MPAAKKTATRVAKSAKKTGAKKPTVKKVAAKKTNKTKPAKKTASVKARRLGTTKARRAARVVGKVMKSVKGKAPRTADLFAELEGLAKYIQNAKKEIAALSPDEVKNEYLPTASGELDAIIKATADATNAIMDSTELIEEVQSKLSGEDAEKLMTATTGIYEACGFQDITGQRITKVVNTLREIEIKVDGLVSVFADNSSGANKKPKKKPSVKNQKQVTDEDLLNGPQASDKAKSQAEIDALLASFD
jgi:chemotaxis protein CheZ